MLMAAMALLAGAQPAPTPAPQPQDQDIVVTGQGPVTVQEARRHVNAITTTQDGQLTRFHSPICPTAIGMGPRETAVVTARIRAVAAAAGVRTQPPGCQPNMALVITPDGRRFVQGLRRARPQIFSRLEPREVRQLLHGEGPVRAWSQTEIFNEDGVAPSGTPGSGGRMMRVYSASIILESTQYATLQSVVVVDDSAADGKSLGQLADYAVMRTLAGTRPPRGPGTSSATILALFDEGGQAPEALTTLDSAYLAALYRSNPRQRSMQQMSQMSRLIAQDTARAEQEGEAEAPR
jgi:hypothetical protein